MKKFNFLNELVKKVFDVKPRIHSKLSALCLLSLLVLGANNAWGDETVTFDGTANWSTTEKYAPDSFRIEASHVTFTLKNSMKQYNSYSWGKFKSHEYFFLDKNASSQLKWWVEEGYTINVSSIYFYSRNKTISTGKGYVHTSRMEQSARLKVRESGDWGAKTFSVNDASDNLFGTTPTALGNTEYFILSATTNEWQIKTCSLTYTITNQYTLSLNNQSATTAGTTSITATYGSSTNLSGTPAITTPTKTGYTFGGYYTETDGNGVQVIDASGNVVAGASGGGNTYTDASKKWKYVGNVILYAKWTANSYTVAFNSNGGRGTTASVDATYDQDVTLTANGFSKAKYTVTYDAETDGGSCAIVTDYVDSVFAGWATSASGSAVYTTDGATLTKPNFATSGTYTLYAKWSAPSVTTVTLPNATKTGGYVLEGWYDGETKVGKNGDTYTPTSNVTLSAKFTNKYDKEITWTQTINDTVRSAVLTLTASVPEGESITYTASPSGLVSISGNVITCLKAGDVTITASSGETTSYFAADDVEKEFTIYEHAITTTPSASGTLTYEQTLNTISPTGGVANVAGSWAWKYPNSVPGVGTANQVAVFTPSSSVIDTVPRECNVSVTVNRAVPDTTCSIALSYNVGHTAIDLQSLWTREGDGAITYSIDSYEESGDNNDDGTDPAISDNRYLSLGKAGSLTLKMAIAQGTNYSARTVYRELTINKIANTLALNVFSTQTKKVDEYIKGVIATKNSDATVQTSTTASGIAYYNIAKDSIVIDNSGAVSFNDSTMTIKIWQDETYRYGMSDTLAITLTVQKYEPSFSGSTYNLNVDDEQSSAYTFTNTSAAKPTASTSDNFYYVLGHSFPENAITTGSSHPDEIIAYDATNNKVTAYNAGTGVIKFYQKETYKYKADSSSVFTVNVSKLTNTLYANGETSYNPTICFDSTLTPITLTATNTDYANYPISVEQTAGDGIVALSYTQGTRTATATSNYNIGDATWHMTQPANYKYAVAEGNFSVKVKAIAEATDCYVKTDLNTEHKFGDSWETTWSDENAAGKLTFTARAQLAWTYGMNLYQLINGNWSLIEYIDHDHMYNSFHTYGYTLDERAKGVKFEQKGTLNRWVKDVYVTRKTYLTAPDTTITKQTDGTTSLYTSTEGKGTLRIKYSLANGGALKIVCDNSSFTFTKDKTNATDAPLVLEDYGCSTNVLDIPVFYSGNATAGNHEAEVLIYNDVYRDTVIITATVVKRPQTITWADPASLNVHTVDTVLLSASAAEQVLFSESSDVAALSIVGGDTLLTFTSASESVTVYADAAANDDYYAATQVSKTWNVAITETEVTTAPTIADAFTSGAYTNSMIDDSDAEVRDLVKNKVVAGTYALKAGEDVTTVGTRNVKLVFTPSNTDMYATSECEVSITVNAKEEELDPEAVDPWAEVDENSSVTIPAEAENIVIDTPVEVYSLTIEDGASVTIESTGGLTIGKGGLTIGGVDKTERIVLEATKDGGSKGQTAFMRFDPTTFKKQADMPEVKMEMFSIGYNGATTTSWQYVGSPVDEDKTAGSIMGKGHYLYGWDEKTGSWADSSSVRMRPFIGYCTSQKKAAAGATITFSGKPVAPGSYTIDLPYTAGAPEGARGCHVLANSFSAPIDISLLTYDGAFSGMEGTIYMFNTGNEDEVADAVSAEGYSTAGQYIAVTPGTASTVYAEDSKFPVVIPPMQGFYVQALPGGGSITLDYDKLVWKADYSIHPNHPMRARKSEPADSSSELLKLTLCSGGVADNLYVIADPSRFQKGFENGNDAHVMDMGYDELKLFAAEGNELLAIDATSDLIGTTIGLHTGYEMEYTIVVSIANTDQVLVLQDLETGDETRIEAGASYSFYAEPNSLLKNRFLILEYTGNDNKPGVTTDAEQTETGVKAYKFIKDGQMYVLKNGVLYNSLGQLVRRK